MMSQHISLTSGRVVCKTCGSSRFPSRSALRKQQYSTASGAGSTRFDGSTERVVLSTSPKAPGTHWYQSRLLLRRPIAVNPGQTVSGTLSFKVNDRLSYDVEVNV